MPAHVAEIEVAKIVALPRCFVERRMASIALQHEVAPSQSSDCDPRITLATAGIVRALRISIPSSSDLVLTTGTRVPNGAEAPWHLHADDLTVQDGTITCQGKARWLDHPGLVAFEQSRYTELVRNTWQPALRAEARNRSGAVLEPGLRSPQLGSLYALAAHWTLGTKPALIVLPTGTGKTEVMLASMLLRRPERLLVLVPTDALRQQTAAKFCSLGVLPSANVVDLAQKRPVVGTLLKAPTDEVSLANVRLINVCVSTVAMIQHLPEAPLQSFLSLFDTVFFDEAHHVPAASWSRINERLGSCCVVGFTATPFRLDGARVSGKVVYQFPLHLAQAQKYFQPIHFIAVDEIDQDKADLQIALRGVEQVRADIAAGHEHILLARAATSYSK
jgi:hypothetical protein